jgi:preprotein translocase subunit SecE
MAKKKDNAPKGQTQPKQAVEIKEKKSNRPSEDSSSFDLLKFFSESRQELSKIVWPSRQQLIGESVTVILMVTLVATTIYLVDNLFVWLSTRVFS